MNPSRTRATVVVDLPRGFETLRQAAARMQVSPAVLYRHLTDGMIPGATRLPCEAGHGFVWAIPADASVAPAPRRPSALSGRPSAETMNRLMGALFAYRLPGETVGAPAFRRRGGRRG